MATIQPTLVQVYDKCVDRVYYKIISRFLWTSHEVVRTDRISNTIVLDIETDSFPDEIIINKQQYKLVKK